MMQATRELQPFHPLFPFVLKYQVTSRFGVRTKFHYHDWYEIVFVHEGNGIFFIDPDFYEMSPGDLFTVPGNVIHQTIPSKPLPYTVSVIQFSPALVHQITLGESFGVMDAFEQRTPARSCRYSLSVDETTAVWQVLEKMHVEIAGEARGHRYAVLSLVHQLLVVTRVHPISTKRLNSIWTARRVPTGDNSAAGRERPWRFRIDQAVISLPQP